ncbi:hypothetical protein O6H91_03G070700 [Diphasiastrum complanatum]|uniref:Uncharacterized protein n=1 Tax=Diphasiastrum complanatum TaxID=34168 RepID=A0ACC2E7X5_DIPCM|nr:hypothetical protein O6H91_03G070700 [Diphasiastrum complanatum]
MECLAGLELEVRPLVFALNGKKVELTNVDPSMTLLFYLREHTQFKGTKYGCGEGGCGACVVLLSRYDSSTRQVEDFTINSCLTPIGSISECSITTTEGLGNSRDGFHTIHKRLAGFHATQCGFCTPGMSISIYGALRQNQKHHFISKASNGGSEVMPGSLSEIKSWKLEKAILGNLCRCTGYRPIVDVCKSFASNVDLEDLGLNNFCSATRNASKCTLPPYSPSQDPVFPQFLIREPGLGNSGRKSLELDQPKMQEHKKSKLSCIAYTTREINRLEDAHSCVWIAPQTLTEAFSALEAYQEQCTVKLVVGNTSTGLFKAADSKVYIDLSHIPELLILEENEEGIEVGAAVSISKLIDSLKFLQHKTLDGGFEGIELHEGRISLYRALASHLNKLGTPHVRNKASVGGNLIMAQRWSFDSDLTTILLGAGALVQLSSVRKEKVWQLFDEFLQQGLPDTSTLLISVLIPYPQVSDKHQAVNGTMLFSAGMPKHIATGQERVMFQTYRAAPRPFGNALSYTNAAFLIHFCSLPEVTCNKSRHIIGQARLAFGAFGGAHAVRANKVEEFLCGKMITNHLILEAILLLNSTLVPGAGVRKSTYRSSVAAGFLFKFLAPLAWDDSRGLSDSCQRDDKQVFKQLLMSIEEEEQLSLVREQCLTYREKENTFITGRQKLEIQDHFYPVGQPATKIAAELQASGEAVYVDDIPSPSDCLYASFVCSEKALGKIKKIKVDNALASPGVVSFVSALDIPSSGQNIGSSTPFSNEKLFATDIVEYIGHPVGLIVADTSHHAKISAKKVEIEYDCESLGAPVISIEDADAKGSFFEFWPFTKQLMQPMAPGDVSRGFSGPDIRIESGEVRTGSQYFFYLENQTALAIPDEDDCLVVYSACQGPEYLQSALSLCLGIPMHNIRVITRRVGGGFGGKALRSMLVATACGLAAYKLKRPVRLSLDRNTDMRMMGGRHATKTVYKVGFKADGKVTALQAKVFIQAGWAEDLSPTLPGFIYTTMKKYNWEAMDVELKVCRTNLPCRSAMRAPGDTQGSFIADTVIEHVASVLGLDVSVVIERNMHSVQSAELFYGSSTVGSTEGFTLPLVWGKLKSSAEIEVRQGHIKTFNSVNKWVKRGLGIVPVLYQITVTPRPARVSIFTDGSVVVEVGGVDIGQGLWTKVQQTAAYALSKLWQGGQSVPVSKIRIVQADSISLPNGGLTSNSSTSEGSCEAVRQVCLILVDRLNPVKQKLEHGDSDTVAWESLIKMVEVDLLTGGTTILRTDLLYDCGKSINPAVDIGQVEGAFMQGVGFFMTEEYVVDEFGKLWTDGTWTYKPPSLDIVPREFYVELLNSPTNSKRILSSKASGEPPLLLASSVHSAIRSAIKAAQEDMEAYSFKNLGNVNKGFFQLDAPATMDRIKSLCGLDNVEMYLQSLDIKCNSNELS